MSGLRPRRSSEYATPRGITTNEPAVEVVLTPLRAEHALTRDDVEHLVGVGSNAVLDRVADLHDAGRRAGRSSDDGFVAADRCGRSDSARSSPAARAVRRSRSDSGGGRRRARRAARNRSRRWRWRRRLLRHAGERDLDLDERPGLDGHLPLERDEVRRLEAEAIGAGPERLKRSAVARGRPLAGDRAGEARRDVGAARPRGR